MKDKDIFAIIEWYQRNKRDLPWRHTKDAYKIWISEIMLQQTRVEAVKEYYERFLDQIPTIEDLAKVSDDKLLKLWEGLGYYSRARNLKKTAQLLITQEKKELPDTEEELLQLPGIGAYTAGAILSIAYLKPVPAIDGNVMRVLSRIYEEERDILNEKVRKEYYEILKKLMLSYPPDDFVQAFIELGALICLPNGEPKCEVCPLKNCCQAHKHHQEQKYPIKKAKKKRKIENKTVFLFQFDDKIALQKRKEGLLAYMYEFPNINETLDLSNAKKYLKEQNILSNKIIDKGQYKHIFSHLEWHMQVYQVELKCSIDTYIWSTSEELNHKYSLPTAFSKIIENKYN